MDRLECGVGAARYEISNEGIVDAWLGGLLIPANAGALSARLLDVGADRGAIGVLCTVEQALVALPRIGASHYGYVEPQYRGIPVAVVVSSEQLPVYADIAQEAARSGTIRRAFLSRAQAHSWLREQALALAANRVWGPAHRSRP